MEKEMETSVLPLLLPLLFLPPTLSLLHTHPLSATFSYLQGWLAKTQVKMALSLPPCLSRISYLFVAANAVTHEYIDMKHREGQKEERGGKGETREGERGARQIAWELL